MASLFDSIKGLFATNPTQQTPPYSSTTSTPFQQAYSPNDPYAPASKQFSTVSFGGDTGRTVLGSTDAATGIYTATPQVLGADSIVNAPTGSSGTNVTQQISPLDQALREAESFAAQRKAEEDAALAAERQRLEGEYGGLQEQLGFRRQTAQEIASQGKSEVEAQRELALSTLGRLRGETQQGLESNVARAETQKRGALQSALAGQQDAQRGIRGRLSAMGNYTSDSTALPALMGLSERDYVQNVQRIQQDANQYINDLNTAATQDLEALADKEAYVENDALQQIAQLRLSLNENLGELNLAQATGDREKISALTQAINQSRARMTDIDANLSDYKNQVNMQKADIQARASTAVQSAEENARRAEEGMSALMKVLGMGGISTTTSMINQGLDTRGTQTGYSGYMGPTREEQIAMGLTRPSFGISR